MAEPNNLLSIFDTEQQSEDGAWLHLTRPDTDEFAYADADNKKPLRIKLKGPESNTWTVFFRKTRQEEGKNDKRTVHDVKLSDAQLMARMTLDTENIPGVDGKDKDSLTKMYLDYQDIRSQALAFILNRENFTKKPAAN